MTVSIVTSIYRTPLSYFAQCVDSVLRILDDDSGDMLDAWTIVIDGDARELEDFVAARAGAHVRKIRFARLTQNFGLSAARNHGVNVCRGDLLTWLDADDVLVPAAFRRFAAFGGDRLRDDYKSLLVISDNYDCGHDLKPLFAREKAVFVDLHRRAARSALDPMLFVDFVYQCQIIRRADFEYVSGFREGQIGEDVELLLRLYESYPSRTLAHVAELAYMYRKNPTGIVHSKRAELRRQNERDYRNIQRSVLGGNRDKTVFREFRTTGYSSGQLLERPGKMHAAFYNVFVNADLDTFPASQVRGVNG